MSILLAPGDQVTIDELVSVARNGEKVEFSDATVSRVTRSRRALEVFVSQKRVIYGVNTSMGGFVNMLVPIDQAEELQMNLIHAVASNVGPHLDVASTRATQAARIVSLARGNSAISIGNLNILKDMLNVGIAPCIPEKGSLGTSGDLGPLACIALVGVGKWKARFNGEVVPGDVAMAKASIPLMSLSYKEGLALVNGTSAMVGLGSLLVDEATQLLDSYCAISAFAVEALTGRTKPFDPKVHELKPHLGQRAVAEAIWRRLAGSQMAVDEADVDRQLAAEMSERVVAGDDPIEDAYSVRCTPQVLGPVHDTIKSVRRTLTDELNSSNDNPLVLPDDNDVYHNGHFHGQYVAMAMDFLSIALVVMCNLSDRRTDRMLTAANSSGLPAFLCRENPGLRLGLMGGQFMSTSLTAENRSLAVPVSTQSLPSTGNFQDIVSLGLVAARRAREVLHNTRYILAFELLCAAQAADIRGAHRLGPAGQQIYEWTRQTVPYLDRDVVLTDYVEMLADTLTDITDLAV